MPADSQIYIHQINNIPRLLKKHDEERAALDQKVNARIREWNQLAAELALESFEINEIISSPVTLEINLEKLPLKHQTKTHLSLIKTLIAYINNLESLNELDKNELEIILEEAISPLSLSSVESLMHLLHESLPESINQDHKNAIDKIHQYHVKLLEQFNKRQHQIDKGIADCKDILKAKSPAIIMIERLQKLWDGVLSLLSEEEKTGITSIEFPSIELNDELETVDKLQERNEIFKKLQEQVTALETEVSHAIEAIKIKFQNTLNKNQDTINELDKNLAQINEQIDAKNNQLNPIQVKLDELLKKQRKDLAQLKRESTKTNFADERLEEPKTSFEKLTETLSKITSELQEHPLDEKPRFIEKLFPWFARKNRARREYDHQIVQYFTEFLAPIYDQITAHKDRRKKEELVLADLSKDKLTEIENQLRTNINDLGSLAFKPSPSRWVRAFSRTKKCLDELSKHTAELLRTIEAEKVTISNLVNIKTREELLGNLRTEIGQTRLQVTEVEGQITALNEQSAEITKEKEILESKNAAVSAQAKTMKKLNSQFYRSTKFVREGDVTEQLASLAQKETTLKKQVQRLENFQLPERITRGAVISSSQLKFEEPPARFDFTI